MQQSGKFSRRGVLAAGLTSGAALAMASDSAAGMGRVPTPVDLTSVGSRLKIYMQLRGSLDERLVIGFLLGTYYGVVGEMITPLYGVVSATFARYRLRSDGSYDGASYEVAFFTDLESGNALEQWRNPYTDETVDVPSLGFPPALLHIAPDLAISLPTAPQNLIMRNRVSSVRNVGPDICFTEETISFLQPAGDQNPLRYNELLTLRASSADLAERGLKRVPCQTSYTSVVSWRPWLRMGDRPGHLMGNGAGRYGASIDELPDTWRAAAALHRPEVLKNPGSGLLELLTG